MNTAVTEKLERPISASPADIYNIVFSYFQKNKKKIFEKKIFKVCRVYKIICRDGKTTSQKIAEEMNCSLMDVKRYLKELVDMKLVESVVGRKGGYTSVNLLLYKFTDFLLLNKKRVTKEPKKQDKVFNNIYIYSAAASAAASDGKDKTKVLSFHLSPAQQKTIRNLIKHEKKYYAIKKTAKSESIFNFYKYKNTRRKLMSDYFTCYYTQQSDFITALNRANITVPLDAIVFKGKEGGHLITSNEYIQHLMKLNSLSELVMKNIMLDLVDWLFRKNKEDGDAKCFIRSFVAHNKYSDNEILRNRTKALEGVRILSTQPQQPTQQRQYTAEELERMKPSPDGNYNLLLFSNLELCDPRIHKFIGSPLPYDYITVHVKDSSEYLLTSERFINYIRSKYELNREKAYYYLIEFSKWLSYMLENKQWSGLGNVQKKFILFVENKMFDTQSDYRFIVFNYLRDGLIKSNENFILNKIVFEKHLRPEPLKWNSELNLPVPRDDEPLTKEELEFYKNIINTGDYDKIKRQERPLVHIQRDELTENKYKYQKQCNIVHYGEINAYLEIFEEDEEKYFVPAGSSQNETYAYSSEEMDDELPF